jgi:D-amino-acid oxidase
MTDPRATQSLSNRDVVGVVGAGVVGLCSAVRILERGRRVVVYSQRRVGESSPARGLSSVAAPAMFTPYPGAEPHRLARWCRWSLEAYAELAERPSDTGVRIGVLREYGYAPRDAGAHAADAEVADILPERPLARVPEGFAYAFDTDRPHILTARLLPWLEARVVALGGRFETRSVDTPAALLAEGHRTIVNCTGVGAGAGTAGADPLVRPLAGQVLHVPNTVGLTRSVQDDARRPGCPHATYIFRYDDRLVLGSTVFEGSWDEAVKPEVERDIIDRCRDLLRVDGCQRWQDLAAGPVIARHVGLRPARGVRGVTENPRVEIEDAGAGRRIIHNYGHGRSGVTLAWGCAREIADWV